MKKTDVLLYNVFIPLHNRGGYMNRNIGSLENSGYEVVLSGKPISQGDKILNLNLGL